MKNCQNSKIRWFENLSPRWWSWFFLGDEFLGFPDFSPPRLLLDFLACPRSALAPDADPEAAAGWSWFCDLSLGGKFWFSTGSWLELWLPLLALFRFCSCSTCPFRWDSSVFSGLPFFWSFRLLSRFPLFFRLGSSFLASSPPESIILVFNYILNVPKN